LVALENKYHPPPTFNQHLIPNIEGILLVLVLDFPLFFEDEDEDEIEDKD